MPSWARQLLLRLTFLLVACAAILGGAWALSGNSTPQGVVPQAPNPNPAAATKPDAKPTEPATAIPEPKKTTPVAAESGRPSRNSKSANLIEVDLNKLPPDLVKEIQGAIVEKAPAASKQQSGEKRGPADR